VIGWSIKESFSLVKWPVRDYNPERKKLLGLEGYVLRKHPSPLKA